MSARILKKYLKFCDVTFIPVKTFINKKSDFKGKQKTWHKSVAGGILSIVFIMMLISYIIHLLHLMVSDEISIVVE